MRRWCHLAHKNLRGKHDIDGEGECSAIEGKSAAWGADDAAAACDKKAQN